MPEFNGRKHAAGGSRHGHQSRQHDDGEKAVRAALVLVHLRQLHRHGEFTCDQAEPQADPHPARGVPERDMEAVLKLVDLIDAVRAHGFRPELSLAVDLKLQQRRRPPASTGLLVGKRDLYVALSPLQLDLQ